MKKTFLSLAALAIFTTNANAATPPEVLEAYKAYNTAMASEDYKSAIKHAKKAWESAEKLMGDSATTGDLAYNYGYVEKNKGENKKALKALERSADLAALKSENAGQIRLEREVEIISSLEALNSGKDATRRVRDALKFAKNNGLENTVFMGELYVHEANACNRDLKWDIMNDKPQIGSLINQSSNEEGIKKGHKKCAKPAQRAVDNFTRNASQARPTYVAAANNFVGYSLETSQAWFDAAMSYQTAREAVEKIYGRDHPLVAQSIGRWLNARNHLRRTDKLEYAEANGLCRCWPYEQTRNTVDSVKTVDPNFPARANQSGYAILQIDVTDTGKPENIRIVHSWPRDVYDKSSVKAMEQWEYAPKTGSEPADFRKNIMVPFNYYLSLDLDPI